MCKKIITHLVIFSFLLSGCYSWELVQEPALALGSDIRILTKNNTVYEMSDWKEENNYIIGEAEVFIEGISFGSINPRPQKKINKNDITQYEVKYLDGVKTTIAVFLPPIIISLIFALTFDM